MRVRVYGMRVCMQNKCVWTQKRIHVYTMRLPVCRKKMIIVDSAAQVTPVIPQ